MTIKVKIPGSFEIVELEAVHVDTCQPSTWLVAMPDMAAFPVSLYNGKWKAENNNDCNYELLQAIGLQITPSYSLSDMETDFSKSYLTCKPRVKAKGHL